ncbi:hypothetical protein LSAT2_032990 [Lamellibrachia satsuma]|nr:hypothetical protein LSAT2_032990 [Lamellibrachia satsuma]
MTTQALLCCDETSVELCCDKSARMSDSNIGLASTFTPLQEHIIWQQLIEKEKHTRRNHISVKGVPGDPAFPGFHDVSKDYPGRLNYYNTMEAKDCMRNVIYNGIFHHDYGYDPKRSRSDRNANVGLDIGGQERKRIVHVAGNSEYGRRWTHLEERIEPKAISAKFGHRCIVEKEFYRANRIGIPIKVDDAEQVIHP